MRRFRHPVRAAPIDAGRSSLRPEDELLLCCARTCLDAGNAARLGERLRREIDWAYLVRLAFRHGLTPLLYAHLNSSAPNAVPADWLGFLRDYFQENLRRNMYRTGALIKILTRFDSHGISALPYKGPIAAQLLYGNLALREFSDLDLLILPEHIPEAHRVLVANGYSPEFDSARAEKAGFRPPAEQYVYADDGRTVLIELHPETALTYFPKPLAPGWLREGLETVSLAGREIRVLAPGKMLVTLCVHGAKDFWSTLKWVCDIAEFVRVYSGLNWGQVLEEAQRRDCERMILLPLFLASELLGTAPPPECRERLAADAVVPELAAQVRRGLFGDLAAFTVPERFFFRTRMLRRFSDGIRYTLRLATTPAAEDRALARLPPALSFAYALLRPLRLLGKHGVVSGSAANSPGLEIPLPGRNRWLFLGAVVLLAGAISVQAGRLCLADIWSRSPDPRDWERAAFLEPGNAEHWYRLARFREWDFDHADVRLAIRFYQRAIELNPRSPFYWMDLASAYEIAGEPQRAQGAFEKAKANYPLSSEVAWNYGNFLLRTGRQSEALAEIHRALTVDPSLTPLAASVCWRATGDVDRILDDLLPPQGSLYMETVYFFLQQQALDAALKVWQRLLTLHQALELKRAFPLLEELIQANRVGEAKQVWQQALATSHWKPDGYAGNSLIWDGGFEHELLNGGFGWREMQVAGANFDFDSASPRSGSFSLRVTFDGSANLEFQNLLQYVPVEPNTRYRFRAYLRLEGVSTDSGIRFRLFDRQHPGEFGVSTPNLTGNLPWMPQEVEFVTRPETRLMVVALWRKASQKFDNKLSGRVWVDDVSLTPISPPAGRSAR